ncbi:uncharacterized protein LOC117304024 [Asterias rubens]|uniref:uncharacterized protein LOC117304024 n=1 Tax=Asterias rubens TaxID=7604 RepID=UPI001455B019|nr:uncharacterized protein LOC117304024 [Asterias rubens]
MSHQCAVYGCSNDRRYPERMKVMPHVYQHMGQTDRVKFYRCKLQFHSKWTRLIKRQDFKVNKNTVVCSNHFKYGQPRLCEQHPTEYLRGCNNTTTRSTRRPSSKKRKTPSLKSAPPRTDPCGDVIAKPSLLGMCKAGFTHDHSMYTSSDGGQSCQRTGLVQGPCSDSESALQKLRRKNAELQRELEDMKEKQRRTKMTSQKHSGSKSKCFSIDDIKNNERLMKLYTGLQSYEAFMCVFDHVKLKMGRLHYYSGSTSHKTKCWQKTGAAERELSMKDELLLTLMKLRLNLVDEDLAFRFCVRTSVVSNIISTLLPFLANELKSHQTFAYDFPLGPS